MCAVDYKEILRVVFKTVSLFIEAELVVVPQLNKSVVSSAEDYKVLIKIMKNGAIEANFKIY